MHAYDYPPEIEALNLRLRAFIRDNFPDAEERVYRDGRSAGYRTARSGAFCGLFPRRSAVYLSFVHGDRLPDPEGLLAAHAGRHIAFRPGEPIPDEALFRLLLAAILIGGDAHG
jgi:hypothetical protein